jgi:hypothetical protein
MQDLKNCTLEIATCPNSINLLESVALNVKPMLCKTCFNELMGPRKMCFLTRTSSNDALG